MTFHWVIAALIIDQLRAGLGGAGHALVWHFGRDATADGLKADPVAQDDRRSPCWCSSVAAAGLAARQSAAARSRRTWPPGSGRSPTLVHWLFYVFMIGMPLAGWAMVSASPRIKVFPISFWGLFDWPRMPGFEGMSHDQLKAAQPFLGAGPHRLDRLARLRPDRPARGRRAQAPGLRSRQRARPHGPGTGTPGPERDRLSMRSATIFALSLARGAPLGRRRRRRRPRRSDHAHSRLGFKGVVEGEPFDGTFRSWDAQISFDPEGAGELARHGQRRPRLGGHRRQGPRREPARPTTGSRSSASRRRCSPQIDSSIGAADVTRRRASSCSRACVGRSTLPFTLAITAGSRR